MSPASSRRALSIDDPVGGRAACDVAHPPSWGVIDDRLREIAVQDIRPNPDQPCKHFDEAALCSLADSIRERGVLQPIIVRPSGESGFELVAGERRWRAAQLAGHSTIPALVDTNLEGAGSIELALVENVAREALTPIEEARTIALLFHDLKVTATALAKRLGRSRTDLAHTDRLLDLPDQAIEPIDAGALTKGHGKAPSRNPTIIAGGRSQRARRTPAGPSETSKPK
jgi:ParB family chromosome partitioning protein